MCEPTSYFWSKCQMCLIPVDGETSSEGQNFGELYGGLLLDELGRQGVPWAEESHQGVMNISRITIGCASRLLELNQFLAKEYLGDPLPIYHSIDEWRLFYAWCTDRFCDWGVMGADVKSSIVDVQIDFMRRGRLKIGFRKSYREF